MNFNKEQLSLENGLTKEWIITNGIGGYASSSILGANTRKYHGLLVASLTPPARRHLILSKLDESVEINNQRYDLHTNVCRNYTSQGFRYLEEFKKEFVPVFSYKINDVQITKIICMEYGKNTVGVYYKIKNGKDNVKLKLAPVVNFRDFHTMSTDHIFDLKQEISGNKVTINIDGNIPVYMKLSEGTYTEHKNDTFYNMFYIEEEKRGFFPEENHVVTGVYEVLVEPNEEKEISFVCSLEEIKDKINVKTMIDNEIVRLNEVFNQSLLIDNRNENKTKEEKKSDDLIREFLIATDNFIVNRPSFNLHTIIAGYPWFLDWGRDSLISFEGLLLVTKRFDIAKEVLLTAIRDVNYGLVPNGYSGYDNRPLYNSADASLLLFEQVQKYLNYTGDESFIKENIYRVLEDIIESYISGIDVDDNNIYLDSDNLLVSGTEYTQNTWMDAKYKDFAITPRNGKVVEINALWYNALMIMNGLSKKFGKIGNARKYIRLAEKTKESFNDKFYNSKRKCLYDVIGDSKIRPNQLFAISLTYPVLDTNSEEARNMFNVVTKKLLNSYGLKSLAKGEENYVDIYEGDSFRRDMSYHQGITWVWLLGLYYDSLKNIISREKRKEAKIELEQQLEEFKKDVTKTFEKEIFSTGCIGSLSELYDSKKPQLPKGAFAQAWSVSEVFRIILGK